MDREDVIRMAREIAAQYSKAERFQTWTHDYTMQRLMELVDAAKAEEREACADLCEDTMQEYEPYTGQPYALNYTCAEAIRARGQS